VINAAAYTAVDKAETNKELAYAVNQTCAKNLALACKQHNIRLLHVSNDFVFYGTKNTPYLSDNIPNPINVYGASKLAGDIDVMEILPSSFIVRTAWVYSAHGNNFVKTMLRLMAEKPTLGIVYDQIGSPTWAAGIESGYGRLLKNHRFMLYIIGQMPVLPLGMTLL
jgi:dTDP-4-dehydrorhamnose reductase